MGLSFGEIAIILIVALVVIGPKKLPDVAKSVGKGYAEFRRAFSDFKKTVDITDINNEKSSAKTYKSRWEEQKQERVADKPTEVAEVAQLDEEKAEEVVEKRRGKRSDLISGDDDA